MINNQDDNYLDDEWINEFEKTDKLYQDFYKDDIYYINLKIIYVSKNNEIEKIKTEPYLLINKNKICYEEIIKILKNNSTINNCKYSLFSILKYNITLEPTEIINYLKNKKEENYLYNVKNINTIIFDKSISMFHDLNELIFIFYDTTIKNNKNTKKKSKKYRTKK